MDAAHDHFQQRALARISRSAAAAAQHSLAGQVDESDGALCIAITTPWSSGFDSPDLLDLPRLLSAPADDLSPTHWPSNMAMNTAANAGGSGEVNAPKVLPGWPSAPLDVFSRTNRSDSVMTTTNGVPKRPGLVSPTLCRRPRTRRSRSVIAVRLDVAACSDSWDVVDGHCLPPPSLGGIPCAPDAQVAPVLPSPCKTAFAPLQLEDMYCSAQIACTKLEKFLDDSAAVDISVADIEKRGLKALLQSCVPMCYFLHALLQDYCCENLFFFLEVEQYDAQDFPTEECRRARATDIFDTYLSQNSVLEVNVSDGVRRRVVDALANDVPLNAIFQESKEEVKLLMEGSFLKFKKSPIWQRMVEDLGCVDSCGYGSRRKASAVLRDFLHCKENLPCKDAPPRDFQECCAFEGNAGAGCDLFNKDPWERDRLVCAMIKAFCLNVAKVDVTDDSNFRELKCAEKFAKSGGQWRWFYWSSLLKWPLRRCSVDVHPLKSIRLPLAGLRNC